MRFESAEIKLSRKGQRQLTPFFGRELAYDYLNGHLDPERREAFERLAKAEPEVREELERIRAGLVYARSLAETQVSAELLTEVNEPDTYLSVLLKKMNFDLWPQGVKWALEAGVVLSFFLLALVVVPWGPLLQWGLHSANEAMILAEIARKPGPESSRLADVEKGERGAFEDEDAAASPATSAAVTAPAPVATVATSATNGPQMGATPAAPVPSAPPPTPAPAKTIAATAPTPATGVAETEGKGKRPGEGVLYRGRLAVTNSPVIGPKVRDQILAMGGRKAGEVELGWERSAGVYYFHFTIPEARLEELRAFFGESGQLQLSSEKHPRVMPDGIIRLIVTVEEAKR